MKTLQMTLTGILVLLTLPSSAARASEQHVVDGGQLAATITQHVADQARERATIREALGRREVRDVAAKIGADLDRFMTSIDTLAGSDLEQAAAAARQVNDRLIGGASTITISTTTLIIALLIIILLIVALK
jgi:hypothetical protein